MPKAFIKLGKIEFMKKYLLEGSLRFAPALEFNHMKEGRDKVADKYEGSLFYPINNVYVAPLVSGDGDHAVYGKALKLADTAMQRITTTRIQKIPFHCLYCYNKPPMNAIIQLDNYESLVQEFPDYDTAIIIYKPLDFLHMLGGKFEIYANYVKYVDSTPCPDELENQIHSLYYKRRQFESQNEFRIALPKLQIDSPKVYEIGSLMHIAYLVPIKCLKYGTIIANTKECFERLRKRCTDLGYKVGDNAGLLSDKL